MRNGGEAAPAGGRERARLILLLLLFVVWFVPVWAEVRIGDDIERQGGPGRGGAPAALSLFLLAGIAAVSRWARSVRDLSRGLSWVSAGVSLGIVGFGLVGHPWLPEPAGRFVPVFLPLALLALLDALVGLGPEPEHAGLPLLRVGSALFVGVVLLLAEIYLWAGVAILLALLASLARPLASPRRARRSFEILQFGLAVVAGLAPALHERLVGLPPALSGAHFGWAGLLWAALCAVLAAVALGGIAQPLPRAFAHRS